MKNDISIPRSPDRRVENGFCPFLTMLLTTASLLGISTGCGVAESSAVVDIETHSTPPISAEKQPAEPSVPKEATTDLKPAVSEADQIVGHAASEVEAMLGKPNGKMHTAQGPLWLYADWRVQFDKENRVVDVEEDRPLQLKGVDPRFLEAANASARVSAQRAAAEDAVRVRRNARAESIRVISNGGQQINLSSLLAPNRITIIDFYADWCGPCQQVSPVLENIAIQDRDVVLVKVDISQWNTPVTRQFGIKSIPNVRVFDRTGRQVGEPASDANLVKSFVQHAKRS